MCAKNARKRAAPSLLPDPRAKGGNDLSKAARDELVESCLNLCRKIARRAAGVNRDDPGAYLGVGAFNLIRADAYRAAGGHEPLRMEVVDDVKLGLLVRRAGRRSRVYFAPRDADADWCPGAWAMVKGLEKNHFAVAGYRVGRVVVAAASSNTDPGAQKTILEWEDEAQSFQDIGFSIAEGIYYQYAIVGSTDMCGNGAGSNLYSFQAVGDLDADDMNSLFEISAGSSSQNVLMRAPGIYRQNELE